MAENDPQAVIEAQTVPMGPSLPWSDVASDPLGDIRRAIALYGLATPVLDPSIARVV